MAANCGTPRKGTRAYDMEYRSFSRRNKTPLTLVTCCALQLCIHSAQLTKQSRRKNWLVAIWGQTDRRLGVRQIGRPRRDGRPREESVQTRFM